MTEDVQIEEVRNELAPFQFDFIDIDEPRTVTIIGSKGPGKTYVGARFVANCVESLPGSKGIFACPTNRQTEDIWEQDIKSLLDALNWQYTHNKNEGIVRFWNGTILHLRSAESPGRIESLQYHWGWQDEVSLAKKDFAKTINSRIRAMDGTGHKRFTSMPDDPDHFIYSWLEDISDEFHEPSLYDNPNKTFVENYERELKSIYHGNELDRYLHGKRVSLKGIGLFAAEESHKQNYNYHPENDLTLVWDFNVMYRAVTSWHEVGLSEDYIPKYNSIESFQLKNSTTEADADALCSYFEDHKADIILHGDASGDNKSAQTSDSMWRQIKGVFEDRFPRQIRYVVPDSNPNVKDTIQVTNWALMKGLISFSEAANVAYRYLVAAKADKYGELDKSNDYNPEGPKTHEVDTIRYLAWHVYNEHFPGTKRKQARRSDLKRVLNQDSGLIYG